MEKHNLTNPIYHDEDLAWAHYEATVWPEGPICPQCGVVNNAVKVEAKETTRKRKQKDGTFKVETWKRRGLHLCRDCGAQFTATVGTVFEDSHIPMTKWLLGALLMNGGKRGCSAAELQRMLGLGSYRSAWFMAMRLREAMSGSSTGPLGGEGKVVEADETYYGRSNLPRTTKVQFPKSKKSPHKDTRPKRGRGSG